MIQNILRFNKTGIFYGWIVLIGAMLVLFTQSGTFMHSFGVFLPVLSDEFGWTRAAVSLALSIGLLSVGLPSPLWGILVTKLGPRVCVISGNLLGAMAMVGMSFVQEIWQYYLLYIVCN